MTVSFSIESKVVNKTTGLFVQLGDLKIKWLFFIVPLSLCTAPVHTEGCSPCWSRQQSLSLGMGTGRSEMLWSCRYVRICVISISAVHWVGSPAK